MHYVATLVEISKVCKSKGLVFAQLERGVQVVEGRDCAINVETNQSIFNTPMDHHLNRVVAHKRIIKLQIHRQRYSCLQNI